MNKDDILEDFNSRMEVAMANENESKTQNEKDYWTGYADAISDAISVVSDDNNNNNNEDLNK